MMTFVLFRDQLACAAVRERSLLGETVTRESEGESSKTSLTPGIFILYSPTLFPLLYRQQDYSERPGEVLPFLPFRFFPSLFSRLRAFLFPPSANSALLPSTLPFSKFSINRGFLRDVLLSTGDYGPSLLPSSSFSTYPPFRPHPRLSLPPSPPPPPPHRT